MSSRAWFVTSATDSTTPLDGPFSTRDECEARCLLRTDRMTVLRSFVARRVPAYYVPHLFEVQLSEVLHYKRPQDASTVAPPAPKAATTGPMLPAVVYSYTRSDLLVLCRSLELRAPPSSADKAAIIEHIEKQLRTLQRGARG